MAEIDLRCYVSLTRSARASDQDPWEFRVVGCPIVGVGTTPGDAAAEFVTRVNKYRDLCEELVDLAKKVKER